MDEEVAKVVAETTAALAAAKKNPPDPKVVVGENPIDGMVRDNEIGGACRAAVGGVGRGQDNWTERIEGLKSWQVYWDHVTRSYIFNDPRVVTPKGTMVLASVLIEANKTYTAQIWSDAAGIWNGEIVTAVQPKEGAVSETSVQIAVVGDITKPGQIRQCHIGAIVLSSAGGGGGGGDADNDPWKINVVTGNIERMQTQIGSKVIEATNGVNRRLNVGDVVYCHIDIIEQTATATTADGYENERYVIIKIAEISNDGTPRYFCRNPIAPVWEAYSSYSS